MGRTLILHIGTNKTGSTTLQNLLCANRPALLPHGAYYADTQRAVNHLLLATMFTSFEQELTNLDKVLWRGRDPHTYLAEYRQSLREEIARLPASIRQVIMSSEHFVQAVRKPADLKRLKAFLDEMFDSYRIVIYLRRQDAHFASSYSQGLRQGMMHPPDFSTVGEYFTDYDFVSLLDRWEAVFGQDAMAPRIYARDADKSFDIARDFTDLLGLQPLAIPSAEAAEKNQSISSSGQRILLQLGSLLQQQTGAGFTGSLLWLRLSTAVGEVMPGKGWRPTRDQARAFVARYAETNEAVRAKWFPHRTTLFSTDFDALPIEAEPADPVGDYENACAALLHFARKTAARELAMARRKVELATKEKMPAMKRAALMQALRLHPEDADSRFRLAAIQIEEKAFDAARRNIEAAQRIAPDHALGPKLVERLRRMERRAMRQGSEAAKKTEPAEATP